MRKIVFDETTQQKILELYSQGIGYKKIGEALNISKDATLRFLKEKGLHRPFKSPRTYKVNESYFKKIDSSEKAYWLGFLYADGNVSGNCLKIRIKKDNDNLELLNFFKRSLDSEAKIKEGEQDSWGTITQYYQIEINSKAIVDDLKEKGCVPNKSLILKFPTPSQVPNKFLWDFLRGYFDGDGSITCGSQYMISFVGTKEVLEGIKGFLGLRVKPSKDKRHPDKNIYILEFGGNLQVLAFGEKLYKNASIFLRRKYNKYLELKNSYSKEKIEERKKYSSLLRQG